MACFWCYISINSPTFSHKMGCAASTTDAESIDTVTSPVDKGDISVFKPMSSNGLEGVDSIPDESYVTEGPPCWRRPTEFKRVSSDVGSDGRENVLEESGASSPFGPDQQLVGMYHANSASRLRGDSGMLRGESFIAGSGTLPRGRSYSIARTPSGAALQEAHTASLLPTAPQARVRRKSVAFVMSSSRNSPRLSMTANRSVNHFVQSAHFVREEEMGRSPLSITFIGREEDSATLGEFYIYKTIPLSGIPFDQPQPSVDSEFTPPWFSDLQKATKIGHRCVQPLQTILRLPPEDGSPAMAAIIGDFYVNDSIENIRSDAARIRTLLRDIILGLRQLHSVGLPHRHLHSRNVFKKDTGAGGGYAIGDLGLGRLFASKSASELVGMGYVECSMVPPEMAASPSVRGSEVVGATDEAHDIWAVGCVCWQAFFGHSPFPSLSKGASDTERAEWLAAIASTKVDCSEIKGSEDFRSVVEWMLEPSPADRPSFIGLLKHPFLVQLATNLQASVSTSTSHQSEALSERLLNPVFGLDAKNLNESLGQPHALSGGCASANVSDSQPPLGHDRRPSAQSSSFKVCEEIRCGSCTKPAHTLAYLCADCERRSITFVVCMACYYQGTYSHPSDHELAPHVVDTVAVTDDALAKSTSSQGVMGSGARLLKNVIIPASNLTERERTILSMTGHLPSTLSIDRRKGKVQRLNSGLVLSSFANSDTPQRTPTHKTLSGRGLRVTASEALFGATIAPDLVEEDDPRLEPPSGLVSPPSSGARRCLLTEAAALGDATVSSVIEECNVEAYSDCMLCNFDLFDIPRGLLDPPMLNITVLDMSNNNLTSVDPDLQYLVNLRRLILGNNRLTTLPTELGNLSDLEVLDVNHNSLCELPQELMFCDQLVELALDYNDFDEIPSVVFDLPCISTIFLAANPRLNKWPPHDLLVALPSCTIGLDNEPQLFSAWKAMSPHVKVDLTISWNKIYPDLIVPNLYCGSLRSAQSPAVYERLNIQYLLTMGRGLEPVVTSSMKHKTVIVDDIEGATISSSFDEATAFIAEAMEKGVGCLVHCFAGMSRSATAVIVYLMLQRKMRLDEAYLLVKQGRPAIHPNDGFFKQMIELDTKTYPGERALDIVSLERDKIP